jgi:hypothetical protein
MANLNEVRQSEAKVTLLDGKEYTIIFNLNTMADIEDRFGTIEAAMVALENNSFKAIRTVLWAGLLNSHPSLTEKEVGGLINLSTMGEMLGVLISAFKKDMPDVTDPTIVANTVAPPVGADVAKHPNVGAPVVLIRPTEQQ